MQEVYRDKRRNEGMSLSVVPKIVSDCQPHEIGMPFNVVVNPYKLASAMGMMGFSDRQINELTIKLKFKEDLESRAGDLGAGYSYGRPLTEEEGYGIEIRIGDIFRHLCRARASFDDGFSGREPQKNRILFFAGDLYWNFVIRNIFTETEKVPDRYKPRGISIVEAYELGKSHKDKSRAQALALIDRRITTVFQRSFRNVLPHELKHVQLNEQDNDEETENLDGKIGLRLLTGAVGGFLISATINQTIFQLASDLRINIPSTLESVTTWMTIILGTAYGLFKGLGWEREVFAHENEAYRAGSKFAKAFSGAITLQRIPDLS